MPEALDSIPNTALENKNPVLPVEKCSFIIPKLSFWAGR
jgi:hypothetical protein